MSTRTELVDTLIRSTKSAMGRQQVVALGSMQAQGVPFCARYFRIFRIFLKIW
jgi:predicted pyridoxine 5'-phosphate oxidase superfamily flavin-nucleotide-binding protein